MISKVTVQNFKRFKEPTEFALKPEGVTFLAGGNNSGKSSLLQALAVWDFARSVIEVTRGPQSLLVAWNGQGVGISAAEFSPIALPNLKHLWTDLRVAASYSLRIRCDWQTSDDPPQPRFLNWSRKDWYKPRRNEEREERNKAEPALPFAIFVSSWF